jgi:hypothetical protein
VSELASFLAESGADSLPLPQLGLQVHLALPQTPLESLPIIAFGLTGRKKKGNMKKLGKSAGNGNN